MTLPNPPVDLPANDPVGLNYRVGILPMFPYHVLLGGFERICIETTRSLRAAGVDIEVLDWGAQTLGYDILHLFGPASHWYDLILRARQRHKIVLSTLAAARGRSGLFRAVSSLFAWLGAMAKQTTTFSQSRQALHWADRIICSNEYESLFFRSVFSLPADQVVAIPNGVRPDFFRPDPGLFSKISPARDYVLFVGNIVPRKNPVWLAQTLQKMNVPGVFIGEPISSEAAYGQLFEKTLRQSPMLSWIPHIDYANPLLASAYANARVFCLPSAAETQPLSAMEAMAAGTAVILGDLPYAYQAPFEGCAKVHLRSTKSLEEVLKAVLNDPLPYRQPLPPEYTWEEVAGKIRGLYQEILGH